MGEKSGNGYLNSWKQLCKYFAVVFQCNPTSLEMLIKAAHILYIECGYEKID